MPKKKIVVSVIIVHYKAKRSLFSCLKSFAQVLKKTTISYEVIIVDNDEEKTIESEIKRKFPSIIYIKSPQNGGYGKGNNLGAKAAKGKYLFFLNPDTILLDSSIDKLVIFLEQNIKAAIVAPLLIDKNRKVYDLQGFTELNPLSYIFALSFFNKLFLNNPIAKKYFISKWDKQSIREVDVVPGTAFIIKRILFEQVNGFDEKFFLFFEEFDLCKRVKKLGYKLYINPISKVMHNWGASTRKSNLNIKNIFKKSRFYYFKKHYGLASAFLVELFASINKVNLLVILMLAVGVFLRFYNIEKLMPFIGDQGWFYLSARDMVLNDQIPLVGIASSHPWLHQGPLWTYMLAGVFWIFGFNPINGAYLTIILGIFTVLIVYVVGSKMFSKRIGLIAAFLYATSPLIVLHSRTPYHTSPMPLFTLFYIFSLYKFIKGNGNFFPLSILFLSILYNLELSTAILWFILFVILIYGVWKKTEWIKKILSKKILIYSFLAFLIPMIPIIIYDFNNNFPQTLKFSAWIGYRILRFFGIPSIHGEVNLISLSSMTNFSFQFYQSLIFAASSILSLAILIFSFSVLIVSLCKLVQNKIYHGGFILLFLWISISIVGYFINKTPSEAYLPIFFPALIYLVAFSFDKIMKIKMLLIPSILLICILSGVNMYSIISSKYFTYNGINFSNRLSIAKEIVRRSNGKDYNIVGIGEGSKFESFTMNYEYLTWWLGHSPAKSSQKLKYTIYENEKGVSLLENE